MRAGVAHPRSRGENSPPSPPSSPSSGSSPLTRGKPIRPPGLCGMIGLIPAHAGKTTYRPRGGWNRGAHPRSRGENGQRSAAYFAARGSSPLTRGKPRGQAQRPRGPGLIPAHAGKTSRALSALGNLGAHPRSRGENGTASPQVMCAQGSSPLTRGKRDRLPDLRRKPGLIPAHAGKTRRPCGKTRGSRAHPRSRGENMKGSD